MEYGHTLLKQIRTWLNEKQYQDYVKQAKKMGMTEYGITKKLATDFIKKRKERAKKFLILYFFMTYSLISTAIILLLF